MTSPGQRVHAEATARLDRLQFYVDSLTNIERSKLAARYLRKVPEKYRRYLLSKLTIAQLAFCEVFSREVNGW
jgi:predicted anti-sigma-YlaC factor YlaD